ncbi:MAG: hypothetical protein ACI9P5_004271 [Saprospiraceae bacterium]|jgi:hypothetical protein
MKKTIIILSGMLIASLSLAQSRYGLIGPAAKNYKPWKNKEASNKMIVTKTSKPLTGPAAKNYKPWKENSDTKQETKQAVLNNRRPKPKGPKAKNYKPWKN